MPRLERPGLLWPTVAAALALAALVLAFLYFRPKPAPAVEISRFEIAAPAKVELTNSFAVSPDGRKLAFIATGEDRVTHLWIRSLETGQARALDGTDNAISFPIWSPDSRLVMFETYQGSAKLLKIDASGGPPEMISDIGGAIPAMGGFWTADNRIFFGQPRSGVRVVAATGGPPSTLVRPRGGEAQEFPSVLPDGHHFLYLNIANATDAGVYLASLDAKPEQQELKKVLAERSPAAYAPDLNAGSGNSKKGFLLFLRGHGRRGGTLIAQPFDTKKLELAGEPTPIAEQVAYFSVSPSSVLVYRTAGSAQAQTITIPPPGSTGRERFSAPLASLARTARSRSRRTRNGWQRRASSVRR